ncbi:MAG TPA: PQQ-binding-like beta-propeller repeat protein [Verrucomicrobiales bacterium]|jgi:outer membrane protein assembly factor BamB|nr:PQQ-binding-like beta-propeller repeat protein [Verrucomicrobiales bacterium]
MKLAVSVSVLILLTACLLRAEDWPQFQGPLGDGTSPETGLLREWPAGGPPVAWRVKIEQGWGAPSIIGDDLVLAWSDDLRGGKESAVCLSAATGEEKWRHSWNTMRYWERGIGWARGGVRATPAMTDQYVFVIGSVGHMHCLDRKYGSVIWARDLWQSWLPSGEKGYDFSPIVADGKLILWLSDGARDATKKDAPHEAICVALDPATGRDVWTWREPHREPARMGEGQTPAIADFAGEKCLVVTANCQLKALRISDGREVWKFDCIRPDGRGTTIPTPLVTGSRIVNIPDLDATHAVEVDRAVRDFPARMLWKKDHGVFTAIHQFRHRESRLYGFLGEIIGESEKSASDSVLRLTCLDLNTGNLLWSEPGFKAGVAIIEADGLLFVRSYGTLRLVEANDKSYTCRGEVKTHEVWKPTRNLTDFVSPVLSNGRLFIRTPEELICYKVKP